MKSIQYLAIICVMLIYPVTAAACTCSEQTPAEQFESAESVFYVRIREAKMPSGWEELGTFGEAVKNAHVSYDEFVVARYRIVEVLKGDPDPNGIVISTYYGPGNCSVPLFPGLYFVIFLSEMNLAIHCSGTFHMGWNPQHEIFERELQKLRELGSSLGAP